MLRSNEWTGPRQDAGTAAQLVFHLLLLLLFLLLLLTCPTLLGSRRMEHAGSAYSSSFSSSSLAPRVAGLHAPSFESLTVKIPKFQKRGSHTHP